MYHPHATLHLSLSDRRDYNLARGARCRPARRFAHKMLVFERYHVNVAPIVVVAFLTLITRATVYAMVGLAVGVVLPFAAWLALVPAYTLAGLIPYSVSGYGGDQAAIVYMLTGFGASGAGALVFALIVAIMAMTYIIIGGLPISLWQD
jgi:hypothetical protein